METRGFDMVSFHEQFTGQVLAAIQKGEDPVAVLEAHKEHLIECPTCRKNLSRLFKEMFGLDLSFIEALRTLGIEKEEPGHVPDPDFTFGGKRILHVKETVDLQLKLPRSHAAFKNFTGDHLASMTISNLTGSKVELAEQSVTLPTGSGLVVDFEARIKKDDSLELKVRCHAPQKTLPEVAVRLEGASTDPIHAAQSAGVFIFHPINPGTYDLVVSRLGPSQIPVMVWIVPVNLQIAYFLDLKSNKKATSG